MQIDQELMSDRCPVCGNPTIRVTIERGFVKRVAHQAGANPMPIEHEIEVLTHDVRFTCGLVRTNVLAEGRWGEWEYDQENTCKNAQAVVLGTRRTDVDPS